MQTLTCRDDLLTLLPKDGIGVELGVAAGGFSLCILKKSMLGHLYSIDMWAGDRGHDVAQYGFVIKRLMPFRARNTIIKMRFDEAAALFGDSFFDFIYVDGYAHTGEENGQTFEDWFSKLKPGGIFAGDDYSPQWPLVVAAVDAFVTKHQLKLNVIEPRQKREDDGADFPSWYVVKPELPPIKRLMARLTG